MVQEQIKTIKCSGDKNEKNSYMYFVNLNKTYTMNIQTEKLRIIEWLLGIEDQTILEKIKFLRSHPTIQNDWWNTISEAEKKSIDRGLDDVEKGRVTPHSVVRKKYEKWL